MMILTIWTLLMMMMNLLSANPLLHTSSQLQVNTNNKKYSLTQITVTGNINKFKALKKKMLLKMMQLFLLVVRSSQLH